MIRVFLRTVSKRLGWTSDSYVLFSGFILLCGVIVYAWWPLAEELLAYIDWGGPWWRYFDWLLVGIWLVMSLLIMAGANLKVDAWIVFVGFVGGLVIESWGTQTEIWWYYTAERPPLWIIPAWPIASLSIDRLVRVLQKILNRFRPASNSQPATYKYLRVCPEITSLFSITSTGQTLSIVRLLRLAKSEVKNGQCLSAVYWFIFLTFFILMLLFVWPTIDKSLTVMSIILVAFLILTPTDHRLAVLTFTAGAGLGYFLEYWGTTRECWTYYTLAKPPFFAVLAHGMAAVAFWRAALVLKVFSSQLSNFRKSPTRE